MSAARKSKSDKRVTDESKSEQVTEQSDEPSEHGLWVNEAFLRKHQNRPPIIALSSEIRSPSSIDRYLELADIALGLKEPKPPKLIPTLPSVDDVKKATAAPKRYRVGRRTKPRTKGR